MPLTSEERIRLRQEVRRTQPYHIGHPLSVNKFDQTQFELQSNTWMLLDDPLLRRHMAFMGTSGSGKSKLIESFCRHLIDTQNGFTFIDPHGDTAQALADYAAKIALDKGDEYIMSRFHYLKPSPEWLFALDPFDAAKTDSSADEAKFAEELTIDNQAQEMADVLLRRFAQQDKEAMRRLAHWLENALIAISTPNAAGKHLAFSDILAVLDSSDPDLPRILQAVEGQLPRKVRQRYDFFRAIRNPLDREKYIESTINNIRAFLKNMPELIFGQQAPSIDFAKVVRNRECVVVNLRATRHGVNERTAMALADFIIHKVKHACRENDEADQRVPHHLIVDEASIYLAEDLGQFLDQARKWLLSVCLSSQRLGQFDRGEVEVSPTVMAETSLFVSFRQKDLEEVRNLGKFFAYPNYNLTELRSRTQVPDSEYDRFVQTTDTARGSQRSQSLGQSTAETEGLTQTNGTSDAYSTQSSSGKNRNSGHSVSTNQHYAPIDIGGTQVPMPMVGIGTSDFSGTGVSDSAGQGRTSGSIHATSAMQATSHGNFASTSQGTSETITLKQSLVAGTREEWDPTGQPRYAIPYQDALHERLLTCLPDRIAFVRTKINNVEQSILFRTPDVLPAFATPEVAATVREAFLEQLYQNKPYMFRPTSVEEATLRRRAEFFATESTAAGPSPTPMHQQLPVPPTRNTPESPEGFH